MNTTITIKIELSPDTYRRLECYKNLADILKRFAEQRLYRMIADDLAQ